MIKKKEEQKTLVSKTCRYSKSSSCVYVPENIIFFSFHLAVVPLHSFHVVSLSSYIRVYPKRERTGGYSRGSMDEDLAAIFKQTRRHCLESLFFHPTCHEEASGARFRKTAQLWQPASSWKSRKQEKRDTIFSPLRPYSADFECRGNFLENWRFYLFMRIFRLPFDDNSSCRLN